MQQKNKGLIELNGHSMIAHILAILTSQIKTVYINANDSLEQYRHFGCEVITDQMANFCGPLAGILATLQTMQSDYLITIPCDAPMLPHDLVLRLLRVAEPNRPVAAHDGTRLQPLFALIHRSSTPSLAAFLDAGNRKARQWLDEQNVILADFSDCTNAFFNANTPQDIQNLRTGRFANPTKLL